MPWYARLCLDRLCLADYALIEKILKIATPTNKKELESFLGLVNF